MTVDLVARIDGLLAGSDRVVLGVVGSPGSGKTTLVEALLRALTAARPDAPVGWLAHVPMDGFHLADVELDRLGLRGRKGAAETFDSHGYLSLLERLRRQGDEVVYAPSFERTLEQPVAGAIPVLPQARLVVTEGNYLLLDDDPWPRARALMDEVWFCAPDDDVRLGRLLARHVEFGKSPDAARDWVAGTDEPNARRIVATRDKADLVLGSATLDLWRPL